MSGRMSDYVQEGAEAPRRRRKKRGPRGGPAVAARSTMRRMAPVGPPKTVTLPSVLSVAELAEALSVTPIAVIKELMNHRIMATINQQVDYGTAKMVADALGIPTEEQVNEHLQHAQVLSSEERQREASQDPEAVSRPPVVTIMGHVDHGKTKLLDAIRHTHVAEGEAGGITQHIGAYQVELQGRKITFLDTPGHEAFTQMRARGAQVTDIAVLVVAADDGVMPQTLEALSHARAAGVPIVVAINKIDRPDANPDRVKQQLAEAGLIAEDYGGDTPMVEVSARERLGIDDLLEVLLLVADIQELKANPLKPASGVIIESRVDRSRGVVATVLIQSGTLSLRDIVVCGATWGRVRAMQDDRGRKVRRAEPSTPVEILGLLEAPQAGDPLQVVADEKEARAVAEERLRQRRAESLSEHRPLRLEELHRQVEAGQAPELRIVLKADVQGSLGALQHALGKLAEEEQAVLLNIIMSNTGAISESDVMLASASDAIVIGFNVRPDAAALRAANAAGVDIRFYDIIYHLVDDIKAAMKGLLAPETREVTDGYAEVRQVFRLPNRQQAAGLYVLDGKVLRNDRVRVLRSGTVLHDGTVAA
ncbi:MAG TPA: translation initiation factor IF-2, partial [Thermomicrobiales bacterium]|nr:translation initiation factor IF-2 [Thermomicrobiales bacterium]